MDRQLRILILIYTIVSVLLLITIIIRHIIKKDFLSMKYKPFKKNCDLWCVSHFIMYLFLGYVSPKYWYISFFLSILWEYFELYCEKLNINVKSNIPEDIIINSLGLLLGVLINSYHL